MDPQDLVAVNTAAIRTYVHENEDGLAKVHPQMVEAFLSLCHEVDDLRQWTDALSKEPRRLMVQNDRLEGIAGTAWDLVRDGRLTDLKTLEDALRRAHFEIPRNAALQTVETMVGRIAWLEKEVDRLRQNVERLAYNQGA